MKKEFKVIVAVVLAVWFFLMGFELGSYREKKAFQDQTLNVQSNNTTAAQITTLPTTLPPTLPATTAEQITTDALSDQTTAAAETTAAGNLQQTTEKKPDSDDPASLSQTQIVEKVATALNAAKSEKNMTAKKTEKVTVNVTDCSVKRAVGLINNIINQLAGEETITYEFKDGQAIGIDAEGKQADDGAVMTPNDAIPPKSKNFSLADGGVKQAKAVKEGENTVYTVTLAPESTTYTTPVPQYHSNAYGYLDLTSLNLSGVTIADANMNYPETVITATVDPDGKLVKLHFFMPMNGDGTAKIIGLTGNATFEGSDDETWEFTY